MCRPLSGVGVLVMTGVLAAVATDSSVPGPLPISDCGIQTGARGGVDGALLLEAVSF